jgi:type III pantothenate kinase
MRIVVDIGNSRIKWGRCAANKIDDAVSLPVDETAWRDQLARWGAVDEWNVAGVQPTVRDRFAAWLRERGAKVAVLDAYRQLPIEVDVDAPERVGLDRLFNAIAVAARMEQGRAALIVDAGSAVTVDLLDETHAFAGGVILPGLRLMAASLHEHTAQLPLVDLKKMPPVPARNTADAIEAGVLHAVLGGIERVLQFLFSEHTNALVYLTGGDAAFLAPHLAMPHHVEPLLTLDGIRLAAESSRD